MILAILRARRTKMEIRQDGPVPHKAGLQPGRNYVNTNQEDQMEIWGYQCSRWRTVVVWVCTVLTIGLLRLVFYWKPAWYLRATHQAAPLQAATKVLLKDQYDQWFVEDVKIIDTSGNRVKDVSPNATFTSGHQGQVTMEELADDKAGHLMRYFLNKKLKYIWQTDSQLFEKLRGLEENCDCSYFHDAPGFSIQAQDKQRVLYSSNLIDVRVDPILVLIFTQVLNPFYVFQVFSCILWFYDKYYYYAAAIVIMSVASLTAEVYQTRTMQTALKSTIQGSDIVNVCRNNGEYENVPSEVLVPGDVIEIPRHGCMMHCDAVLIAGNCIVNESMLTGESVPVTKTPLPNPRLAGQCLPFDIKDHARHTLFCGTKVIQTRFYGNQKVKAVVVRTGFSTAKGDLVRSILFPKPVDFKFSQDAFKFIGVLALISSVGMVYTIIVMTQSGESTDIIIVRCLDLITIVIPPALPAAMTIGIVFAQRRLKACQVYCISPRSINLCGALNTFCFDKTGTLTEDGLDLQGILASYDAKFQPMQLDVEKMGRDPLVAAMATCHSLTIIEGEMSGDPLDLKMFEATGWELEEPGEDTAKFDVFTPSVVRPRKPDIVTISEGFENAENLPYELGILRQFTFSSKLQRMSVIARSLSAAHFSLYAKGAPEMIASLCKPDTVPPDFHDILLQYTQHGYRVLALAWRPLHKMNYVKCQRVQREQVECQLTFLGLLVMENRLKAETTPVIDQLNAANIRTIMITGDNMLTALSVARDCHMIHAADKAILVHVSPPVDHHPAHIDWTYAEDVRKKVQEVHTMGVGESTSVHIDPNDTLHFAITGKSWQLVRHHFPDIVPKLMVRGTVFARFSPDQKQQLVETLQEMGYYVGMCGDGANDCGALKTAHAGISLSEAEASVASPFTSKTPNISCVPTVIREGRAALVTSFGVFKYMAAYSLTQFVSVCMLYWISANLTDFTFLYIDLFLITSLGATFSYTGAYPDLVPRPPPVSLLSLTPLISIISHVMLMAAFQICMWFYLLSQPWFYPFVWDEENDTYFSFEVTALFSISAFQYVTSALCFAKGPPYRKTMFSNWVFMVNVALLTGLNLWVVLYPTEGFADFLELKQLPSLAFRGVIVGMACINFFLCFLLEVYVIDSDWFQTHVQGSIDRRYKRIHHAYVRIGEELADRPEWPPISQSSHSIADIMRMESAVAAGDSSPDDIKNGGIVSKAYVDDEDLLLRKGKAKKKQLSIDSAADYQDTDPILPASPESPRSPDAPLLAHGEICVEIHPGGGDRKTETSL